MTKEMDCTARSHSTNHYVEYGTNIRDGLYFVINMSWITVLRDGREKDTLWGGIPWEDCLQATRSHRGRVMCPDLD